MKKKITLNKKTLRKLQLKLRPKNDRKAAPLATTEELDPNPSVGEPGCTQGHTCTRSGCGYELV